MARRFFGGRKIRGLSTDTKPTAPEDDAEFYETDTKKTFDWSGSAWVERITGVGSTVEYTELAGDIPLSKLANGTAGKIIGFNASTGAPEEQEMSGGDGAVLLPNDTTIANFTSPTSAKGSSNKSYNKTLSNVSMGGSSVNGSNGGQAFWSSYAKLYDFAEPTTVTQIAGTHRALGTQSYHWSQFVYYVKDASGNTLHSYSSGTINGGVSASWSSNCNVSNATEFGFIAKSQGIRADVLSTNFTGTQPAVRNPSVVKDADDTTYWQSDDEDNPWLHVNMGSTTATGMIAIKPHTDTNDTVVTIQTGNNSGYADIEDDFTESGSEWTKVGSATTVDDGVSNKVYINNIDQNSGDHRVHKNIGTLDSDKWMVDVDLESWTQTYLTGTPAEVFYLSTGTTEPSQTSELHVGVRIWTYSTSGNLQLVASDGSSSTSSSNLSSVGNTTPQYIRIIKDGDTITLKSFSDSARTTGEISQSITATGITGLNTIHFGALCSEQNAFTATMDNLGIWNGVTSVPSADWTTRRTVNVSNLTAGSWNFIRFPAVECKVLRIRGNGTNKTLAISEIKVKNNISATTIAGNHIHKDISTTDTSLGLDGT